RDRLSMTRGENSSSSVASTRMRPLFSRGGETVSSSARAAGASNTSASDATTATSVGIGQGRAGVAHRAGTGSVACTRGSEGPVKSHGQHEVGVRALQVAGDVEAQTLRGRQPDAGVDVDVLVADVPAMRGVGPRGAGVDERERVETAA